MSFFSDFTKFDGLLDRKNLPIFQFLNPITEPTQDVKGRIIQIWHYQKSYLGAVLDVDGSLTIVPESHIHNGLQPNEVGTSFLSQIASSTPKKWGLVALSNRHLVVWPHLVAAGRPDSDLSPAKIDSNIGHIFRESEGHLLDTPENRQLLISVASDHRNWVGTDEFGNEVYLKHQPNGSQVWIHRRGNRIGNGGANLPGKHSVFVNDQKTSKGALQRYFELSARTNAFAKSCLRRGAETLFLPPGGGSGNGGPGIRQFQQLLQQTGLVRSYNSSHPYNPMPEKGGIAGEIGGVACSTSYIKGLFDGPESLFEESHFFSFPALPDGKPPFTEQELGQILRELAIGVYVHSAVPFFSLHFRQEGSDLFPVVHPVYEHTLVGRVIGMLDYIMKGYLNGGIYQESFIDDWYRNPDWRHRSDSALQELINFHEYCQKHMEGKDKRYKSLAALTASATKEFHSLEARFERMALQAARDLGIPQVTKADGAEDLFSFKGFRNSFRIIAKQSSIQKEGNLFHVDGDFDVFYDIKPSPLYEQALEAYTRQHGRPPFSHEKLLELYKEAQKDIHDHMTKMPLCRSYFAMLSMINFFTSYFSTLKQHRKIPSLPLLMESLSKGVPSLFPHLPTVTVGSQDLYINIQENVHNSIKDHHQLWTLYLSGLFDHILSGNKEPYIFSKQEQLEAGLEKTAYQNLSQDLTIPVQRALATHLDEIPLRTKAKDLCKAITAVFRADVEELQKTELNRADLAAGIPPGYTIQVDRTFLILAFVQQYRQALNEYCGYLFDHNADAASLADGRMAAFFEEVFLESILISCLPCAREFVQTHAEKIQWKTLAKRNWDEIARHLTLGMQDFREFYDKKIPQFLHRKEYYSAYRNEAVNKEIDAIDKSFEHQLIKLYTIPPPLSQRREGIIERFLNFIPNKFPNKKKQIFSLNIPVPYLPNECSSSEQGITNRVVGGCGLNLQRQEIQPSQVGRELIEGYLAQMLTLEPESFLCVARKNGERHAIFRLEFQDLNSQDVGNYEYLEKTLLAPQEETPGQWEQRVELEEAIQRGDRTAFEHLLHSIPNLVHICNREKKTPLHLAASLSDPFYTTALLAKGVSPNVPDAQGYLPIHYASMTGECEVLKALITPATVNAKSSNGTTPILVAIQHKKPKAVRLLLAQGAHLSSLAGGYTALHSALHEGDDEVLTALFDSPEIHSQINVCSYEGGTPLMLACELENIVWAGKLLELGADPQAARPDGITALEVAIRKRSLPMIKKVYHATQIPSSLALKAAAEVGNHEVLALMLPHLYSYQNVAGDAALHIAICKGNIEGALYLIEHCSNIAFLTTINQEKQAPSTLAAIFSFWEIIEALWRKKVPLDLKQLFIAKYNPLLIEIMNDVSLSLIQLQEYAVIAAQVGNMEALSFIFKPRGVCLGAIVGPKGWRLLHYLAKHDGIFLFKQEIMRAADLRQPLICDHGKTLAAIAAESGSRRVLKALLLLMQKQGVSLESAEGSSHLLVSAIYGNTDDIVWEVFDKELSVDSVLDGQGSRGVHIAARIGSLEALERFIGRGANLNVRDARGWSPLDYAASIAAKKTIQLLLEKGSRVTAHALYLAALLPQDSIFSLMITYNKEAHILDEALMRTLEKGDLRGFQRLRARNASLHTQTEEGWTLTLRACMTGQDEILAEIVREQIAPDERTYLGRKPLDWAMWEGYDRCVEILRQAGYKETLNTEEKAACEAIKHTQQQLIKEVTIAVKENNPIALVKLLETTAREEVIDKDGNTVLHKLVTMLGEGTSFPISREKEDLVKPNRKGVTPLHIAAQKVPAYIFSKMLDCFDKKTDLHFLDITDTWGRTPLFLAVLEGNNENASLLIDRGASVNHRDNQLLTPLGLASWVRALGMVRLLLEKGADPNQWMQIQRCFPLHIAVRTQQSQIVQALLNYGAKTHLVDGRGNTILSEAIQTKDSSLIRLFRGTDYRNLEGQDFRHVAALRGNSEMLQAALGTDLEDLEVPRQVVLKDTQKSDDTITLLGSACRDGNIETAAWLLAQGADPAPKDLNLLRPFRVAAGHSKALSLLPLFNAFRIAHDPDQLRLAIRDAICQDHVASIQALYARGIPIDSTLMNEETGLHIACRAGAIHCTAWLLRQGANPFIPTQSGVEAFEIAAKNSSFHQFRLLITATQVKVDLNRANDRGETYMHLAAAVGNLGHILVLMQCGACSHQIDNTGLTPLHVAARQGHAKVVRLFLACGKEDKERSMGGLLAKDLVKPSDSATKEVFTLFSSVEPFDLQTPLHLAIRTGSTLAARFLAHLFSPEKINQRDIHGDTALHIAIKTHQQESALALIQVGADIESIDGNGCTPLWLASIEAKSPSLTRLLIGAGANANYVHPCGRTLTQCLEPEPLLLQIVSEAEWLTQ